MKDIQYKRQGALSQEDGTIRWCVWSPVTKNVHLVIWRAGHCDNIAMTGEDFGYHSCQLDGVDEGTRYAYLMPDGRKYPDPASLHQPGGVHSPSAIFFPETFRWSDCQWRGASPKDLVIYELHVGTFTPEGTLEAIIPRIRELAALGVTALELMPVAQFSGERNWGYDGVHPFAVQNSYGGPRSLQRLVDAAHQAGMAVLLDVVYNHFGPEGNYFAQFGPYFTDRYRTPWGKAINFDGPDSDAVRRLVIDNALMWVRDFHIDGLRLDAVDAIYDLSAQHILAEIQAAVQEEAERLNRKVHVIAECDLNDVRLVRPVALGGYGLDGVWSDDFHHSVHSLLTGQRDGYYQDFGSAEHLAKALNDVYVYDGTYSDFRRRRHGSKVGELDRTQFVVAVQNHDQVGNRAAGDRFGTLLPPEAQRLACGLLLLSPCIPMLFMGEEYGETAPFPFFCSFSDPKLIKAVRRGRRNEFANLSFQWKGKIPDPQSVKTFESAKLRWQWSEGSLHAHIRSLYHDLLAARRCWPGLCDRQHTVARAETVSAMDNGDEVAVLILQRGHDPGVTAFANLTSRHTSLPNVELADKMPIFSTEEAKYGGVRSIPQPIESLRPYELIIFGLDK